MTQQTRAEETGRLKATVSQRVPWFPIVMLHRVVEHTSSLNPYNLCISQTDLARLISFLRRTGFHMSTVEETIAAWERGEDVRRHACLTFDDGYEDFYTHAWPMLHRLECPASVYLVTQRLGGTNTWDSETLPEARLLREAQVKALSAEGIQFGAHSATHPRLPELTPEQRVSEIAGAKRDVEALTGREASVFVYPHWANDAAVRHEVFEAGYRAACGGEQSPHSRFELHRLDLPRYDEVSMRFRVHGWRRRLHGNAIARTAKTAVRKLRHRR